MLEGRVAARRDERAQARLGERDLLVGRSQSRPFGIQHGIDQIGVCQSLLDRLGASRTAKDSDDEERELQQQPRHAAAMIYPRTTKCRASRRLATDFSAVGEAPRPPNDSNHRQHSRVAIPANSWIAVDRGNCPRRCGIGQQCEKAADGGKSRN